MKKYRLSDETYTIDDPTCVLHRVVALKSFGDVKAGDVGGFLESESNLSQDGDSWIADVAIVCGSALVCENAVVGGHAFVCGDVVVGGESYVGGRSKILGRL